MGTFLLGADMSHHNYPLNFNPANLDFVWLKATEGINHADDKVGTIMHEVAMELDETNNGDVPFIGFYHFCRADKGNDPVKEAKWFNYITKKLDPENVGMYALDIEAGSILMEDIDEWANEFCRFFHHQTGKHPLIYCSASSTPKFKLTSRHNKLWVAHYNTTSPKVYNWKEPTFWQFTSTPFDINIFYGTRKDLEKICLESLEPTKY